MGNQVGKGDVPAEFKQFASQANKLLRSTRAPREELLSQLTQALKTGGETDVNLPTIQRAVEASNQASSQAIGNTAAQLGAAGLQGSPFAARILAEQRLNAGQAAGQTRTNALQAFLGAAIPSLTDFTSLGLQGAGQGAQGFLSGEQFKAQAKQFALDSIGKNSSAGASAFCMAPSCRVQMLDGSFKAIDAVAPGELVWTRTETGARIPARVVATSVQPIGPDHEFAVFNEAIGSPTHPVGDGTLGDLTDKRTTAKALAVHHTYDLLIHLGTGEYFVATLGWTKSTLDRRHRLKKAA